MSKWTDQSLVWVLQVLASAAVFSTFHLDPSALAPELMLGLIFGAASLQGGRSIWASALPHCAYNLTLLFLALQHAHMTPSSVSGLPLPAAHQLLCVWMTG